MNDKRIEKIVKIDHKIERENDINKIMELQKQRAKLFEQIVKDKLN